jgi:L-phenylalanine/L-methionine N-acetyltransferase
VKPTLTLRPVEPHDYEAVRRIYEDASVISGTLQLPMPTLELWKKRIAEQPAQARVLLACIATGAGEEAVGHAGLHPMPQVRRAHVAAIGMAVRERFQGQGVGTALLRELIAQADNWLHLTRLELTVFTDNAAAIALYKKHGFTIEGTMAGYALRAGEYVDAYAMARLHPHPPQVMPSRSA